jgi:spermidine synthase
MSDGTELTLTRHVSELVIEADGHTLMSSRLHGSEDALATLGCARARALPRPRVLIGGLGMGFTLRAALDTLPPDARIVVAELAPAVVEWNRGPLGPLAGHPLDDGRVRLELGDVAAILRSSPRSFDAVLLDVDNGPAAMSALGNAGLYTEKGIAAARASLTPGGVLAIWSVGDERRFARRLRSAGFNVVCERVSARGGKGGPRHTVLVAHAIA